MPLSLPTWSQTKTSSKTGFDKVWAGLDKLGAPVNRLSNKIGSESFWPTTLDKESDKAARILRSFCKDGFYVEEKQDEVAQVAAQEGRPRGKQRVLKKIPTEVIQRAKGLAIFTTMRSGLWISGAGGSGVLVARKADGSWSPPSGILLHTAGLGFLVGIDIYDCVVVINTEKALQAFTKIRCTLGGEVSAVAGPVGMGGVLETEIHKRQAPVWNYLKSRGFYAGVQIDGTVVIERSDENERFYGEKIPVADILAGKARHPPLEIKGLMNTIKAAQGDTDIDEATLPSNEPTPGDYEIRDDHSPTSNGFGLPPDDNDPDPFGVRALEQQGMQVREAGTRSRPSTDAFDYRPSPTSPIFSTFQHARKNSKRDSGRLSIASTHTDRGTQTANLDSPRQTDSPLGAGSRSPPKIVESDEADAAAETTDRDNRELNEEEQKQRAVIHKAKLVTIPKRVPPALPPRHPERASHSTQVSADIPIPRSPIVTEHDEGSGGLGINLQDNTSKSEENEDGGELHPMPSEDSVNERIEETIHLVPSNSRRRASSSKRSNMDGSVSGSDYSRAATPLHVNATTEEFENAIAEDEDNEPTQSTIAPEHMPEASKEMHGDSLASEEHGHKQKDAGLPSLLTALRADDTPDSQSAEDFHSLSGTPLESTPVVAQAMQLPVLHKHVGATLKEKPTHAGQEEGEAPQESEAGVEGGKADGDGDGDGDDKAAKTFDADAEHEGTSSEQAEQEKGEMKHATHTQVSNSLDDFS